jgi:ribosomal protein S18 acetylase RimI-like enzyme
MLTAPELLVRWYQPCDLKGLRTLFAECYPAEQWRVRDFIRFANKRERENVIKVLVDENDPTQRLLAAVFYTKTPDECLIRRIAVPQALRRQGYATEILRSIAGLKSPIQVRTFTAVVPESNLDAILFFRDSAVGFRFDPGDRRLSGGKDAYVFRYLKAPRRRRALANT